MYIVTHTYHLNSFGLTSMNSIDTQCIPWAWNCTKSIGNYLYNKNRPCRLWSHSLMVIVLSCWFWMLRVQFPLISFFWHCFWHFSHRCWTRCPTNVWPAVPRTIPGSHAKQVMEFIGCTTNWPQPNINEFWRLLDVSLTWGCMLSETQCWFTVFCVIPNDLQLGNSAVYMWDRRAMTNCCILLLLSCSCVVIIVSASSLSSGRRSGREGMPVSVYALADSWSACTRTLTGMQEREVAVQLQGIRERASGRGTVLARCCCCCCHSCMVVTRVCPFWLWHHSYL